MAILKYGTLGATVNQEVDLRASHQVGRLSLEFHDAEQTRTVLQLSEIETERVVRLIRHARMFTKRAIPSSSDVEVSDDEQRELYALLELAKRHNDELVGLLEQSNAIASGALGMVRKLQDQLKTIAVAQTVDVVTILGKQEDDQ
jgi:hypothetical protein